MSEIFHIISLCCTIKLHGNETKVRSAPHLLIYQLYVCLQGVIQDLIYVPQDFAAYEHSYKYCPTCDYEFPAPDAQGFAFRSGGGGEASGNFSWGSAYEGGKMEAGYAIGGMDKKETVYVSFNKNLPIF